MKASIEDERFAFGANWARFLDTVDEARVNISRTCLAGMLGCENLSGMAFLDIGCGSGLSSLSARALGAAVHSFDYDAESVACTKALRRQFFPDDPEWMVEHGDVLDAGYVESLGKFDIVYSWGVLHHTGNMELALRHSRSLVKPGGLYFIAIYNDQGRVSRRWKHVKRLYNRLPSLFRFLVLVPSAAVIWGPICVNDAIRGDPLMTWRNTRQERGMSPWHNLKDWVGGYPFEVAAPDAIIMPLLPEGFVLRNIICRTTGHGCNEYVFERSPNDEKKNLGSRTKAEE